MPTVTVSLPTDIVAFIEGEIAAGGYATASDVVRDSLRRLQQAKAADDGALTALRREVGIGIDQARSGRFSDRSVADIAAAAKAAVKAQG